MDRSEPIWPPDEILGHQAEERADGSAGSPPIAARRATSLGWGEVRADGDAVEPLIWDTVPEIAESGESRSQAVLSSRSPWAAPPRAAPEPSPPRRLSQPNAPQREKASPPVVAAGRPNAAPAGQAAAKTRAGRRRGEPARTTPVPAAPGVYRMEPARGPHSLGQLTVIGTNASAGRAVARLLTVTLQHPDPDAWGRAVDVINLDEEYAYAGDLLARDHGLTVVEAGADLDSSLWRRAVEEADELVVAVNAAGGGPGAAAALLDAMVQAGYEQAVQRALTVVLLPVNRLGLTRGHEDVDAIRHHFKTRTRHVAVAPFDLRPTSASRNAWRRIVETITETPRTPAG